MLRSNNLALIVAALLCSQVFLPALAFPKFLDQARKFQVKSNNIKKASSIEGTEKIETSTATVATSNNGGFSWVNMMGTLMQLFLGGSGGIDKSDQGNFNWMNLIALGARLLMQSLSSDSLDKSDSGVPPAMQLIQLATSLLDALRLSFSQRSSQARSIGEKDPLADVGIASVTILKGYVNTMKSDEESCSQRVMCEANRQCANEANESGYLFCQLGTLAAGYVNEIRTNQPIDNIAEAGRRGRTGENCAVIYNQCNEL
ncbi:uncharacterized protein LOC136030040 [Artemia franciscana]|uniref:Secreted protein n=1 Tax=Artemia franciscana TaxID=6661 RepID=A0AA88HK28_ARTSF|nr:hypothetical protein QYM36_016373 [Artemia franciscana]KAK2706313.1 hypothetical protein QYM36_016373 [Artemia franciscana]KAK2706314.1 hypothetical protein QYM36_016373 [Artemia franciscana]